MDADTKDRIAQYGPLCLYEVTVTGKEGNSTLKYLAHEDRIADIPPSLPSNLRGKDVTEIRIMKGEEVKFEDFTLDRIVSARAK
ncbi:MAG: hypothetical protein AABX04_06570 [Nanoarchaeota archaeon]|mgnify:CR=1 FL=1